MVQVIRISFLLEKFNLLKEKEVHKLHVKILIILIVMSITTTTGKPEFLKKQNLKLILTVLLLQFTVAVGRTSLFLVYSLLAFTPCSTYKNVIFLFLLWRRV